jgi:pimeloyl-ACP methyl ester carboxylesterase
VPFVAADASTEEGTSKRVEAGGMSVHYHELGRASGEPILFLHSYGPGTTAWITFHKVIAEFAREYHCILFDMPNFAKTGPIVFNEGVHSLQARVGTQLLDALGIESAYWVGNSQGGQSGMVAAIKYPERVRKFVLGGSHIGTGGDRYLMANRPSEGGRATREASANPTKDNIRRYLRVHIDQEALVTDELVDYIHHWHTYSPEFIEARSKSSSPPHDYTADLTAIKAPAFMVHGRYDRMVQFEVSINMLNHIENSRMLLLNNTGHWPPFERPVEYAEHVLTFLRMKL